MTVARTIRASARVASYDVTPSGSSSAGSRMRRPGRIRTSGKIDSITNLIAGASPFTETADDVVWACRR